MIGVALHLGACALDDACETVRDLGWAATFAAASVQLALAARLDPEAARAVGEVARLRAERDGLRRLVLDAVDTRERLEASDHEAEETGQVKSLSVMIEDLEAWNRLVEAVRP